ncbi:PHP domain-containing protein, partial [Chryseobacterium sp.]|uniref:PHP domain-containing protein n=1 Tax=Chryseobacterium sp. TaxID=1871047 RepID=UPI0028A1AAA1
MFINCHSYHSLRYGTISVKELVQQCVELEIGVAALTDINCISGIYDFHRLCEKKNIKPVVGVDIRNDNRQHYICLAKNQSGIGEINRLLTTHNCEGIDLPLHHPDLSNVFVIYPLSNFPEKLNKNEYIGIHPEEINLLIGSKVKKYLPRIVILQPVTFKTRREYTLHKILRAIDRNTLVTKLDENDICGQNEKLIPTDELLRKYQHYPQIIENTKHLLEQCHFDFDYKTPKNKKNFTKSKNSDIKLLKELAYKGFTKRYPDDDGKAKARMDKELTVIDQLNFCAYFLITWDIIQYSNRMGFMHVGRGSGANSIVAYCLGITDICPLELDLYFERFLNLNRKTPPDFDIDWSWQNRDAILQYIFD